MQPKLVDALSSLGLTLVEAKVYECLLRDGPSTGYRVAKTIGHAVANIYGALASLQAKGAVIADGGTSRHVRAVPADEFLGRLEGEFRERRRRAAELLSQLHGPAEDLRVYRIERAEQVLERAEAMLKGAEYCALIDAFPGVLDRLRRPLESAAARCRVIAKAYAPVTLRRVAVLMAHESEQQLVVTWLGQHLHLVVDARECLLALFDTELTNAKQAIWTACPFVTSAHHVGLQFEFMYTRLWTGSDRILSDALTQTSRTGLFAETGLGKTPGYADFARMVGTSGGPGEGERGQSTRASRKQRRRSP
ncbi:MAG: hypothetical protein AMXMBFR47_38900 [Planctomycetota bacterium]